MLLRCNLDACHGMDPRVYIAAARPFRPRMTNRWMTALKKRTYITPLLRRLPSRDALDLQVILEPVFGVFAAVAGLLVAAEGQAGVPLRIVDVDIAGAHAGGDFTGLLDVLGLDVGGQAIDGVVGGADRFFDGVVRH